jgi:riboflavin synthase alpha subunit
LGGHSCSAIKVCGLDEGIFEYVVREASGAIDGESLHVNTLGSQVGEFDVAGIEAQDFLKLRSSR